MPANVNEPNFVKSIVQDAVYGARDNDLTITDAAGIAQRRLDQHIYSNLSVNDGPLEWVEPHDGEPAYQRHSMRRLTWQEAYERRHEQVQRLQSFETFVRDLDRCQHGRHQGDTCTLERGCGGPSKGNIWMQDVEERRTSNGDDDERPVHFGLGHAMSGDSYFLRRPSEPGMLPVAIKRRYRDADGKLARVDVVELGAR